MPYSPAVTDKRAELTANAMGQIADLRFQGGMAFGQGIAGGISQAGSSIAQGVSQAGQTYAQNTAKQRNNLGKLEVLGQAGVLEPTQLDQLSGIKDPDKLAGALAVVEDMMQMSQRKGMMLEEFKQRSALQDREYQLKAGLAAAESMADRTGQTVVLTDPVTGQKRGGYYGNRGQVLTFPDDPGTVSRDVTKVDLGGGAYAYVDGRGRPLPASAIMEGDPATGALKTKLTSDLAAVNGEIAKDKENLKPGPDWWPFTTTYAKKREGLIASLETLEGQPAARSTAPPTVTTREQFDALPSGTVYIGKDGKKYRKP